MTDALHHRDGLPAAFRYLEAAYPRSAWPTLGIAPMAQHWLDVHGWFRDQMDDLRRIGGLWREGQVGAVDYRGGATPRLRQLLNNLHHHHSIESDHAFPALIAAEPRMADGFALLDRDHHAIEALMAAMVDAANALTRGGPEPDALTPLAHALADTLDQTTTLIARHLNDEEEIVIPVLTLRGDAVAL